MIQLSLLKIMTSRLRLLLKATMVLLLPARIFIFLERCRKVTCRNAAFSGPIHHACFRPSVSAIVHKDEPHPSFHRHERGIARISSKIVQNFDQLHGSASPPSKERPRPVLSSETEAKAEENPKRPKRNCFRIPFSIRSEKISTSVAASSTMERTLFHALGVMFQIWNCLVRIFTLVDSERIGAIRERKRHLRGCMGFDAVTKGFLSIERCFCVFWADCEVEDNSSGIRDCGKATYDHGG